MTTCDGMPHNWGNRHTVQPLYAKPPPLLAWLGNRTRSVNASRASNGGDDNNHSPEAGRSTRVPDDTRVRAGT